MGLFDFLKPKKNEFKDTLSQLVNSYFPKGEKDINAGTEELLYILNNSIDKSEAKVIFIQSFAMCQLSEKFDKEDLKAHLKGYCIQHFNEAQIGKFYGYLTALTAAKMIHKKTPSEVIRRGDSYFW